MTRSVYWSAEALGTLDRIFAYFGEDDPDHALNLIAELEAAADKLGQLPTGRPGRMAGTFEKSLPGLRYILVYVLDTATPDGALTISRVILTSQGSLG